MFRLIFTFLLPLLFPLLGYLVWSWLQLRRAPAEKRAERLNVPWSILAGAGVSLLMVTLLILALLDKGGVPGQIYTPPHFEDGKLIPGQTR
jgi:hypothetical protein